MGALRNFVEAPLEDFNESQKVYFMVLAETEYTENKGIIAPLSELLRIESVIARLLEEYHACFRELQRREEGLDASRARA